MSSFSLPDLGEGLHEAEIVAWHVAAGDHVVADQPLVSVETEKAVVEVPSPRSGRIARLLAAVHDRVKVGAPIVDFEDGGHADAGTVVGELGPTLRPTSAPPAPAGPNPPGAAAPAVRALARERGVDLARLIGHGPAGAITRDDVEREAAASTGEGAAQPLRGVRRSMALNMARAHAEVVPATLFDDADIESWWSAAADVTVRLIRAIAAGCAAAPALNAAFDGTTMTLRPLPRVDLGVAVDTAEGLIVPVLRDVGRRDPDDLRRGLDALKLAVRARTVSPADLRGPSITLSNFGTLAGRHAVLVIVPPQVAIIGAGRIVRQAVPGRGRAMFRHKLPLSLTFDHRAATGGDAARFLKAAIDDLQHRQ
jgi:pyruvate dehydrogenase E2 component (dihydrolipoamide acetyltransferase)